ncbi:exopolysaccharide biosynthesis protein [Pseudooceanicola sp. LIPI14-2-Ac024]|uniref:exopolysaccharide biosynthesis protein n=1 Tax=Pseudooceanicola sp. LIPI14-2-Ac024 TaxID=3344875 RepID=UPI0035CEF88B
MSSDEAAAAAPDAEPGSVREVIARMGSAATGERTQLRAITEAMGEASFVPVLMAPALAVVSPLSGIPLFSTTCGLLIALVSIQMLINRDHIWLPDWIMRREVPSERLRGALKWLEKPAAWLDRHSRARLQVLVARPFDWITEFACFLCGAMMPFLELVPFSSSTLGMAVVLFSLALLVRDGLYSVLAIAFLGLVGSGIYFLLT